MIGRQTGYHAGDHRALLQMPTLKTLYPIHFKLGPRSVLELVPDSTLPGVVREVIQKFIEQIRERLRSKQGGF